MGLARTTGVGKACTTGYLPGTLVSPEQAGGPAGPLGVPSPAEAP